MKFDVTIQDTLAILRIDIEGIIEPEILGSIKPPDPVVAGFAHLGVILDGRMPLWLLGYLVHFYHPVKFLAVHDPRLNAAVVVASHVKEIIPGQLIQFKL